MKTAEIKKGKINVETENIFPIIKKFLYSENDIFLRELVSNAVDATQKLKTLSNLGEYDDDLGNIDIEIKVNKKEKTITVADKGIGMTKTEIDKYINQVAFSSAEEFIKKYKGKSEEIIGHFGLGFYSAFIVADKVEIITKSYQKNASAAKWECDGSPNYIISKANKKNRGTEVILHISDNSKEFLEDNKIEEILNKYCKFLPVPIKFNNKQINDIRPLWIKNPADNKDEDYLSFYKKLYPFADEPLFYIHLNIDYPFKLTGILYFPKIKSNFEIQKNKIKLFCNQVFVTDSVEGIVPEFLQLLHGVIDSPDIPLNVSRSALQTDSNVRKISSYITKKVSEKLDEIFKNKKDEYIKKWDDIKLFIEYGMLTNEKFFEKSLNFYLLKNDKNNYYTIKEYKDKIAPLQKDKNNNIVFLYANDLEKQHSFIEQAKERGYDVLIMDSLLTSHLLNKFEYDSKIESLIKSKSKWVRVDANPVDKLIEKEEETISKLDDKQKDNIKKLFETVADKNKFDIKLEALSEKDMPVLITFPEFSRRFKEMSEISGMRKNDLPLKYNLIINVNHPIMGKLLIKSTNNKQNDIVKQLIDIALLSQNMLKGKALTEFVKRNIELLNS